LKPQHPVDPRPELAPPPKEAVLFGGKRVSFYLVEGVGLIEIIDEGPQAQASRPVVRSASRTLGRQPVN
jgi:hypothetical protein